MIDEALVIIINGNQKYWFHNPDDTYTLRVATMEEIGQFYCIWTLSDALQKGMAWVFNV